MIYLLLATTHAGPPPMASTLRLSIEPAPLEVHTAILADGFTAVFVVRPAAEDLVTQLEAQRPKGTNLRVVPLSRSGAEIELGLNDPLLKSRAVRHEGKLDILVEFETRDDAMRRRVLTAIPRSVPSAFLAPRLRDAEATLHAERLQEAGERFASLARQYALRSWAELRLADILLLTGDRRAACTRYRTVTTAFPTRTAGLVARMRIHALECIQKHTATLDWTWLVERLRHTEGAVGRYLLDEATWTIHLTHRSVEIHAALSDGKVESRHGLKLPRSLKDSLVARAIRRAPSAYSAAHACITHRTAIPRHSEARSLALRCATSLLALDLPEEAIAWLDGLPKLERGTAGLWKEREGSGQTLVELARAYAATGRSYLQRRAVTRYQRQWDEPPRALRSSEPPEIAAAELPVGRAVADAKERLATIRRHLDPPAPAEGTP